MTITSVETGEVISKKIDRETAELIAQASIAQMFSPRPSRTPAEFVYFIQAAASHLIKIGSASNPRARLRSLQVGSPDQLRLLGHIPGGAKRERDLHERFASDRSHGEWFKPSVGLTDFIKEVLA